MTDAELTDLESVFRYCARVPDGVAVAGIARGSWSEWDSMAHVSLIGALESQFDLQFALEEALAITDWTTCVASVSAKLAARG